MGLTAALNLAQYGIPFTLLEAADDIFEDPRAGTIHPPTLEMFAKLGLTETLVEREKFYDELRAIVADEDTHRQYVMRVAMIEGIRRAAAIT